MTEGKGIKMSEKSYNEFAEQQNGNGTESRGAPPRKSQSRWLMLLSLCLAAALVAAVYQGAMRMRERESLITLAENNYQRDFHDLTQNLDDITGQLAQVLSCSSREQLVLSLSALWRQSFAAQANLGGLPLSFMPLEQTENFLGATADTAYYLLWRTAREDNLLVTQEKEHVLKLYQQARHLRDSMDEISTQVVEQDLKLVDVQQLLWRPEADEANAVIDGLSLMETGLAEYPEINISGDLKALTGPSSEYTGAPKPLAEIQGAEGQQGQGQPDETQPRETQPGETQPGETQPEETQPGQTQAEGPASDQVQEPEKDIGAELAIQIAKDFWLGENAAGFQGRVAYESVGDTPTYSVELSMIQNNITIPFAEVDVVKRDGHVLWAMAIPDPERDAGSQTGMMSPPAASEERLLQGGHRALDFLAQRNFPDMVLAYSQEEGGYGVYTLTPLQEGVRLYSDQVKVQVDLQEMKITGYEGSPFYRNHKERVLEEVLVTRGKLMTFISPYLRVEETNLALIQDDWGKEILTWEVRAVVGTERFSLYYNCTTGAEEKIIRL